MKLVQPGERGYNRQQLRKLNEKISIELENQGFKRKSCIGMVRIRGVLIPHGWIKPNKEQIQAKLTELGKPNGKMELIGENNLFISQIKEN